MIRLGITVGEPAGIGPDICIDLAGDLPQPDLELTFIGDARHLSARAAALGLAVQVLPFDPRQAPAPSSPGTAQVWQVDLPRPPPAGRPDPANALALLEGLDHAVAGCLDGRFDACPSPPS